jgi:excisionase family DNA binding protein
MWQLVDLLSDERRRYEMEKRRTIPKRRPDPPTFVDIAPLADKSDADVARALGCTTAASSRYLVQYIQDERSGRYDEKLLPGQTRCEAGVKLWSLLRCHRLAVQDERWCWHHHPEPPQPPGVPRRLHPWELAQRPDGNLLAAMYGLTEQYVDLNASIRAALTRLERADEEQASGAQAPKVLTVPQAAELLGLTPRYIQRLCRERRLPFFFAGRQYRFIVADLDDWMAGRTHKSVR